MMNSIGLVSSAGLEVNICAVKSGLIVYLVIHANWPDSSPTFSLYSIRTGRSGPFFKTPLSPQSGTGHRAKQPSGILVNSTTYFSSKTHRRLLSRRRPPTLRRPQIATVGSPWAPPSDLLSLHQTTAQSSPVLRIFNCPQSDPLNFSSFNAKHFEVC